VTLTTIVPHVAILALVGSWLSPLGPVNKGVLFAVVCSAAFLLALVARAICPAWPISSGQVIRRRKPMRKQLLLASLLETVWAVGAGAVGSALAG
jgi:hypothetical protein